MKYNSDARVQFSIGSMFYNSDYYRYVYYRIVPSELRFFQRLFCNPWRKMWKGLKYAGGTSDLISVEDFKNKIVVLRTFGEVQEYLREQNKLSLLGEDRKRKDKRRWDNYFND